MAEGAALLGRSQNTALVPAPSQLPVQSRAGRAAGFTSVRPRTRSNTTPRAGAVPLLPALPTPPSNLHKAGLAPESFRGERGLEGRQRTSAKTSLSGKLKPNNFLG